MEDAEFLRWPKLPTILADFKNNFTSLVRGGLNHEARQLFRPSRCRRPQLRLWGIDSIMAGICAQRKNSNTTAMRTMEWVLRMDQRLRIGAVRNLREGRTVIVRRVHHNRKAIMKRPLEIDKGSWHPTSTDEIFARTSECGVVRLTCPVHLCGGQRIACGNLWKGVAYQALMCAHCCHSIKADKWYCECGIQLRQCEVHQSRIVKMAEGVGSKHCPKPNRRLRVKTSPSAGQPQVRQRGKQALQALTLWDLHGHNSTFEPYCGARAEVSSHLMERVIDLGYAPTCSRRDWVPKCKPLLVKMPLLRAGMSK